jgi:hypothetical protein
MLIIVSFAASGCNRIRSQATAVSTQPASLDKPRPVRPASCPLTLPPSVPFTPPGEHMWTADEDQFWLGTDKLYIDLPKSGAQWVWFPRTSEINAKIFWGSVDFDYHKKEDYTLKVTGRRLDGDTPPFEADRVTNALSEPRAAMLTGVYIPAPGCWEITGDYKGAKLSYVVWVYADNQ